MWKPLFETNRWIANKGYDGNWTAASCWFGITRNLLLSRILGNHSNQAGNTICPLNTRGRLFLRYSMVSILCIAVFLCNFFFVEISCVLWSTLTQPSICLLRCKWLTAEHDVGLWSKLTRIAYLHRVPTAAKSRLFRLNAYIGFRPSRTISSGISTYNVVHWTLSGSLHHLSCQGLEKKSLASKRPDSPRLNVPSSVLGPVAMQKGDSNESSTPALCP